MYKEGFFKEQVASAQALREDHGNIYEQGYVSCMYDSEARHLQALRTSTLTWKCRGCDSVSMYKRRSTSKLVTRTWAHIHWMVWIIGTLIAMCASNVRIL